MTKEFRFAFNAMPVINLVLCVCMCASVSLCVAPLSGIAGLTRTKLQIDALLP